MNPTFLCLGKISVGMYIVTFAVIFTNIKLDSIRPLTPKLQLYKAYKQLVSRVT